MTAFSAQGATFLLAFFILPLWIAAGFADYLFHRATAIERTSGLRESALHLVQFGLVGLPVTLALFLAANAGFLLLALVCIILHHGVAIVDVVYANRTRAILPREQMVHSVLEIFPIAALALIAALHWPQAQALFGAGPEMARFRPEPRPLALSYVIAALGGAFLFNLLPYLEELWRCVKAARR
jgi:hypothetical protein